jgi:four helix bundle protein
MKMSMILFESSKSFPLEERYSLTDQVRCCSRSVCANIAEAWRKRRYPNSFVSKLSDAEAEAAETQVWIEFSVNSGYLDPSDADKLDKQYEFIQGIPLKTPSRGASRMAAGCLPRYARFIAKGCPGEDFTK